MPPHLRDHKEHIHAGRKENQGDTLQTKEEILLLSNKCDPGVEHFPPLCSSGTFAEHSTSHQAQRRFCCFSESASGSWWSKFDREELAASRQICLLILHGARSSAARCCSSPRSQTDSAVRSHSSQSSRFLTPPSFPCCTQQDCRSRGTADRAWWLMHSSNC